MGGPSGMAEEMVLAKLPESMTSERLGEVQGREAEGPPETGTAALVSPVAVIVLSLLFMVGVHYSYVSEQRPNHTHLVQGLRLCACSFPTTTSAAGPPVMTA